jgi:hypothetical protein
MGSSEIAAIIDSSPSNTSAGPGEQWMFHYINVCSGFNHNHD